MRWTVRVASPVERGQKGLVSDQPLARYMWHWFGRKFITRGRPRTMHQCLRAYRIGARLTVHRELQEIATQEWVSSGRPLHRLHGEQSTSRAVDRSRMEIETGHMISWTRCAVSRVDDVTMLLIDSNLMRRSMLIICRSFRHGSVMWDCGYSSLCAGRRERLSGQRRAVWIELYIIYC